mgnify:CR=1 FL=1
MGAARALKGHGSGAPRHVLRTRKKLLQLLHACCTPANALARGRARCKLASATHLAQQSAARECRGPAPGPGALPHSRSRQSPASTRCPSAVRCAPAYVQGGATGWVGRGQMVFKCVCHNSNAGHGKGTWLHAIRASVSPLPPPAPLISPAAGAVVRVYLRMCHTWSREQLRRPGILMTHHEGVAGAHCRRVHTLAVVNGEQRGDDGGVEEEHDCAQAGQPLPLQAAQHVGQEALPGAAAVLPLPAGRGRRGVLKKQQIEARRGVCERMHVGSKGTRRRRCERSHRAYVIRTTRCLYPARRTMLHMLHACSPLVVVVVVTHARTF